MVLHKKSKAGVGNGRAVHGGEDICIFMADSHCYVAEVNATL